MAFQPDQKYRGKVAANSQLFESQTGTMGFQVAIECEEGLTEFVIWLTEKNRKRAEKYFGILGVPASKLQDPNYLEFGLAQEIEGREVTFGTKEETYNGNTKIKVAWIGRPSSANGPLTTSAANFFGAKIEQAPARYADDIPLSDDDIPF